MRTHARDIMRAILSGFAGVAPRSVTPNLVELLSTFVTRYPLESKQWMQDILNAVRQTHGATRLQRSRVMSLARFYAL